MGTSRWGSRPPFERCVFSITDLIQGGDWRRVREVCIPVTTCFYCKTTAGCFEPSIPPRSVKCLHLKSEPPRSMFNSTALPRPPLLLLSIWLYRYYYHSITDTMAPNAQLALIARGGSIIYKPIVPRTHRATRTLPERTIEQHFR